MAFIRLVQLFVYRQKVVDTFLLDQSIAINIDQNNNINKESRLVTISFSILYLMNIYLQNININYIVNISFRARIKCNCFVSLYTIIRIILYTSLASLFLGAKSLVKYALGRFVIISIAILPQDYPRTSKSISSLTVSQRNTLFLL